MDDKFYSDILTQLTRIADALERQAAGNQTEPNYLRDLDDYHSFDWASIGAEVIMRDNDGATHVQWQGQTFLRRSPSNKYDPAIWYSRGDGKDEDGSQRYVRLITFREFKTAAVDPLPERLRQNAPAQQAASSQPERVMVNGSHDAGQFAPNGPKDYETFWTKSVPYLGISKERAKEAMQLTSNNAEAAYEYLVAAPTG